MEPALNGHAKQRHKGLGQMVGGRTEHRSHPTHTEASSCDMSRKLGDQQADLQRQDQEKKGAGVPCTAGWVQTQQRKAEGLWHSSSLRVSHEGSDGLC